MRSALLAAVVLLAPAAVRAQQVRAPDGRALVAEAERLQDVNDDSVAKLVARALPLLQRPDDGAVRARALAMQCWAVAGATSSPRLIALADRGMAAARAAGDARSAASLQVCRGYGHESGDQADAAMADYELGIREGRRLNDPRILGTGLMLDGEQRYYRGELGVALEELNEAYAIYQRLGNQSMQRYTLNAIANLYADDRVAQYDRAIEYYRQILAANRSLGKREEVATGYYNIGSTLEQKGDLTSSLVYYRRSLEVEAELKDAGEVATCQRSIGVVLTKLGRPAEALGWLNRALAYFGRVHDDEREAQARLSRGVALRTLGRPADALRDLDAAAARFRATHNDRFLEKVADERARALAASGDWRGAFAARTEQIALQRALADRLREENTSRLRVRFDSEKKEQENRALIRENALRGRALRDAARIRSLQRAVIGLTLAIIAALAALIVRHVLNARRLRTMALTDELTRIPNRRHLLSIADQRVSAARRGTGPLSVLALDVDHFKRINDSYGHEVGDRVLHRVAATCRSALRRDDVIGRVGGEEFVVIMPGADAKVALEVAERLRSAVERVEWSDLDPSLRVTVSVGATEWAPGDDSFAALARRADDSLYRAKERGRNRIVLAPST